MTTHDKIRGEKLLYDINREAAKIPALSSGKVNKQKYPTVEEILPLDQNRVIEQANFFIFIIFLQEKLNRKANKRY